ncbi:hypothetical protein AB0H36_14005 [Kribbella sp. NPDC050820]|uniref:hypothetical protein n=1 Tax=Kribbella sp. NPDC050820 TaxID=3155408 RepID=UPI0033EA8A50
MSNKPGFDPALHHQALGDQALRSSRTTTSNRTRSRTTSRRSSGYPIEVDIWLGRDEVVQAREARLVFGRLVEARPQTPMLLCHDLGGLVVAYVPGRGVHEFPAGTTMDAADAHEWRDWVPDLAERDE